MRVHGDRGAQIALTAGPSTSLRSGRDDKLVLGATLILEGAPVLQQNCHPDRSEAAVELFSRLPDKQSKGLTTICGQAFQTAQT
jgi:hypothetical protein